MALRSVRAWGFPWRGSRRKMHIASIFRIGSPLRFPCGLARKKMHR
jgi:hypothetical protein